MFYLTPCVKWVTSLLYEVETEVHLIAVGHCLTNVRTECAVSEMPCLFSRHAVPQSFRSVMERSNGNQSGKATSVLFIARLPGFMWTPSKAWILSQSAARSLSPNNLLQNTSLSFPPIPLSLWTALAKSRGELALPLKMASVPLHFLPHHCVPYGLWRGLSLCSIWPRLLQYLNMMMAATWLEYLQHNLLQFHLQWSQTEYTQNRVMFWMELMKEQRHQEFSHPFLPRKNKSGSFSEFLLCVTKMISLLTMNITALRSM